MSVAEVDSLNQIKDLDNQAVRAASAISNQEVRLLTRRYPEVGDLSRKLGGNVVQRKVGWKQARILDAKRVYDFDLVGFRKFIQR